MLAIVLISCLFCTSYGDFTSDSIISPTGYVTEGFVEVNITATNDCATCIIHICANVCAISDRLYSLQIIDHEYTENKAAVYTGELQDRYTFSAVGGVGSVTITLQFTNLFESDNGSTITFEDGATLSRFTHTLYVQRCLNFTGAVASTSQLTNGSSCIAYTANCITTFTCDDEYYQITNSAIRTCGTTPTWIDNSEICNLKCPDFVGANVLSTTGSCTYYEHNCETTFQCNHTYYHIPDTSLTKTCTAPGTWNNQNEICKEKCSDIFTGAIPVEVGNTCTAYTQNCTVLFECVNGYSRGIGNNNRTCNIGDMWDDPTDDICIESCTVLEAKYYVSSVDASCTLDEYFAINCMATVGCADAYVGNTSVVQCVNDTLIGWNETFPTCIERCAAFSGATEVSNKYSNGSNCNNRYDDGCIATFQCNDASQYPSDSRTCLSNGVWDNNDNPCLYKCPDFNGATVVSTVNSCTYNEHGCEVTFECDTNYYHVSGTSLTNVCQAPGTWDNTEDICKLRTNLCPAVDACTEVVSSTGTSCTITDYNLQSCSTLFRCKSSCVGENFEVTCQEDSTWSSATDKCSHVTTDTSKYASIVSTTTSSTSSSALGHKTKNTLVILLTIFYVWLWSY